jgi:hypothetical protein
MTNLCPCEFGARYEHRPRSDDEWDAFARAHAIPEADLL